MQDAGFIYEKIDDLVKQVEVKVKNIDLSELNTVEDLSEYIYDSKFKTSEYRLIRDIVTNFDEETGIALLDLLRQNLSDALAKLFGPGQ